MTDIVINVSHDKNIFRYEILVDNEPLETKFYFKPIDINNNEILLSPEVSVLPILGFIPNLIAYRKRQNNTDITHNIIFRGDIYKLPRLLESLIKETISERIISLSDYLRNILPPLVSDPDDIIITYDEISIKDIHPIVVASPKVFSSFSFGKESLLNNYLCSKDPDVSHNFSNPRLLFLENKSYNARVYSKEYEKYPNLSVIRNNFNFLRNTLNKSSSYIDNIESLDYSMYYSYLAIMYSTKTKFWSLGNEIDCTRPRVSSNGQLHYHYTLYDESNYYETLIDLMAKTLILNSSVFSLLSPIFEIKILDLLKKLDPDALNNLIACWRVGMKTVWCGKCPKCQRYVEMYNRLNIPLPSE